MLAAVNVVRQHGRQLHCRESCIVVSPAGAAVNALLVGANTVNGPGPLSVITKPVGTCQQRRDRYCNHLIDIDRRVKKRAYLLKRGLTEKLAPSG
jgi:hypothetical protein